MSWFSKFKRPRTVAVYALAPISDPDNYITYATSIEELENYFAIWFKTRWTKGFKIWCNWQDDADPESEASWIQFMSQDYVLEDFSNYTIYKLNFSSDAVASLLRMQNLCTPFDLPHIYDFEKTYYSAVTFDLESTVLDAIRNQIGMLDPKDKIERTNIDGN